jgi:hypothetical protein
MESAEIADSAISALPTALAADGELKFNAPDQAPS